MATIFYGIELSVDHL